MDKEVKDYIYNWHHVKSSYQDYPQRLKLIEKLKYPELLGYKYTEENIKFRNAWKKSLQKLCNELNTKFNKYKFEVIQVRGYGIKLIIKDNESIQEAAITGKELTKARERVEAKIYKSMDILDKTGQNSEYYKQKFAQMSDKEFFEFFKQDFPLKFQTKVFEIDPKITQIMDMLNFLKVPILEKIAMPFMYKNSQGVPVMTQPVLVTYLPIKRLKQMVQKKSGFSVNISKRDYRTGLLIDTDKNGNSTDREFESLAIFGFDETLKELSSYRADAMNAKNAFYAKINNAGMVSQKDIPVDTDDSIARNLISAYLIGSHIQSNLVNVDNFTPRAIKRKNAEQSGLKRQ